YGASADFADARHRAESVLARHNSIAALMSDRLEFDDVNRGQTGRIGEVGAATTIIHGSRDASVPLRNARRLEDALPNSSLVEVAGATHILPETHPAVVAEAIVAATANSSSPAAPDSKPR
ncbi:MAG: alpha/beta hydrolase, partial [Solirubrobacterales bacterium]